jgi:hypothetical protein
LLVALVIAAASMVLHVFLGVDDAAVYFLRVIERVAKPAGGSGAHRRAGHHLPGDRRVAGPVLRRAMRDGNTPVLARWLADGSHA